MKRNLMTAAAEMRVALNTALAAVSAFALAGCAVPGAAPHDPAAIELPAAVTVPPVAADWWKAFGDPQLDAVVEEALQYNRDLARAMARIDESRAALGAARAERLPRLDARLSSARQRASENGSVALNGTSPVGNVHRAALAVAYEVDLWARAAQLSAAAREELLADEYARATLRTALVAQVVQAYATLQALDAQRDLYGRAVAAQRDSLALQRLRFQAGDVGELDIRQLEAELLANETQLPKLDRARGEAQRALALVLGRTPRALIEQDVSRTATPVAVVGPLPAGLPADLLLRRPDVLAAEARLRAAGARVAAARAAYFPSITLTADWGRESTELSRLTDAPSLVWGVVASLTQPIWDAGRIGAQNEVARARRLRAELDYRDSVAVAFKEARDALAAQDEARASLDSGLKRAMALERAAALTQLRYEGGEASRLDVIEAERASLTASAQNADARRALAAAQADLFRALGGGWRPDDAGGVHSGG